MKDNSNIHARFARTLALLRSIEAYRPERERLFDDHFSQVFLPDVWKFFLLPGLRQAFLALYTNIVPGLIGSLYCRTAYIDAALSNALQMGARQVVILGAGFDARPYRIPGIQQAHVFELDLPEPQRLKQALIEKTDGGQPAHVTFVSIDFDQQDLESSLSAAGFQRGLQTIFIWEAVTQYITAEAVERTFSFMCAAAAAGSQVVFTYVPKGAIDGTAHSHAVQNLLSSARQAGMPWIFGLDPNRLAEYLQQRGLELVEDVGAAELRRRYLEPRGRLLHLMPVERVALARITDEAQPAGGRHHPAPAQPVR